MALKKIEEKKVRCFVAATRNKINQPRTDQQHMQDAKLLPRHVPQTFTVPLSKLSISLARSYTLQTHQQATLQGA